MTEPTLSTRGFAHMPEVRSQLGGHIRTYESSAAFDSRIWMLIKDPVDLNRPHGETKEGVVAFAQHIVTLCANHYHIRGEDEAAGIADKGNSVVLDIAALRQMLAGVAQVDED